MAIGERNIGKRELTIESRESFIRRQEPNMAEKGEYVAVFEWVDACPSSHFYLFIILPQPI